MLDLADDVDIVWVQRAEAGSWSLEKELVPDDEEREAATARFLLDPEQAVSFVEGARDVIAAGRPPCPICGRSINPEGHICPRSNGHGSD